MKSKKSKINYRYAIIAVVLVFAMLGSWYLSSSRASSVEPADINNDNKVDVFDLSILLSNWNKTGSNTSDINGDSTVNIFDLSMLLSKWGFTVSTTPYSLKVEAESYSNQNGIQTNTTPDTGGGLYVGWTQPGDWVQYTNLNFTSAVSKVEARLATPVSGSSIEVRLDSATGIILGTISAPNTGSWDVYQTVTANLNTQLSGNQTVVFVFRNATVTDMKLDINWFNFTNGVTSTPTPTPTPSVTPTPTPTPTPSGTLIWSGDYETGNLSQFNDTPWNNLPLAPAITSAIVKSGSYAGVYSAPAGGNSGSTTRCENVPKTPNFVEGSDLWFSFSTRVDSNVATNSLWQVIAQWKNDGLGSPPLELSVTNGRYLIEGGWGWPGTDNPTTPKLGSKDVGAVVANTWENWLIHVKFSDNPSIGFVDAWRNGNLVVGNEDGLDGWHMPGGTLYPGLFSYLKNGYYRSGDITTTGSVYQDNWKVGTTRAIVTN